MSHIEDEKAVGVTSHVENSKLANEHVLAGTLTPDSGDFSHIDEKKLMRKVDWRIVPWLCVLYLLSFLDRSAIGNAKLYGLAKELELTSTQYNICLTVFFFSYSLFEVPSNILLKRLTPKIWFPIITVAVGICMMAQGLVHSYGGLLATRFLLGMCEAGLFPGVNYLMSGWYKRNEFGVRAGIFFSAATVAGAFGGLLSFGLNKMDGVGGYHGWRWIFIIIGIATACAGFLSYWLCENFPDKAKFLKDDERAFIIHRLQADQQFSAAGESFHVRDIGKAFVDPKMWLALISYASIDCPLYAFSLFTPTIINQLGYTANRANLLSIPIYVVACIAVIGVGFSADRLSNRAMFSFVFAVIGMIGYAILIGNNPLTRPGVSYFACYLAAIGIYPLISNIVALTAGNAEGAYKRSVAMAVVISFGNIQGAVSSNIYPAVTAPYFRTGHAIIMAYLGVGCFASVGYWFYVRAENKARLEGRNDETILSEQDPTASSADLHARAAEMRRQRVADIKAQGGLRNRIKALYAQLDEAPGGVYADIDEARKLKGDAWSGFQYRT